MDSFGQRESCRHRWKSTEREPSFWLVQPDNNSATAEPACLRKSRLCTGSVLLGVIVRSLAPIEQPNLILLQGPALPGWPSSHALLRSLANPCTLLLEQRAGLKGGDRPLTGPSPWPALAVIAVLHVRLCRELNPMFLSANT